MRIPSLSALILAVASVPLSAQCGTPGTGGLIPRLALSSDLWASSGVLSLSNGLPGAHWVMALDTAPGPVATPIGLICVGFSPGFSIVFNSTSGLVPPLDGSGAWSLPLAFPPATAGLLGLPFYLQGAVLDLAATGGLAISNGTTFALKAPKVAVANVHVGLRSIDILDGERLVSNPATALLKSITAQGHDDFALSPDGRYIYLRDLTYTVPNRVRCFDLAPTPPVLIGTLTVSATGVGLSRRGIDLDSTGNVGYFCDLAGTIRRFDANPASPSFMTLNGSAAVSLNNPDTLIVSPDDQYVFVVGLTSPGATPSFLCTVSTATMTQIGTTPLTDTSLLFGLADRGPLSVSPLGNYVATTSFGFYLPGFVTATGTLSIVDTLPGSATFLQEIAAVTLPRYDSGSLAFDPRDISGSTLYLLDSDHPSTNVYLTTVTWPTATSTSTLLTTGADAVYPEGGVDTTSDGSYIYTATQIDRTVRVLDAVTQNVVGTIVLPGWNGGRPDRMHVERR